MTKKYINFLQFVLFFVFLSFFSEKMNAQCAGNDGNQIICNISDPVNQSVSLFALLGGSPVPGGTWTDDNGSRGLNTSTGILNAQLIRSGGSYQYTYTAPSTAGCTDNKATVTITIGPFSGDPAPYATKCSDEQTFNLFSAFNSTVMSPHNNGVWTNSAGQAVSSTISITEMQGTYQFTYTVPPVLACSPSPVSSTVVLTVFRAPEPGTPGELALCGTTDLDGYTSFDVSTLLTGQDPGGRWSGHGITGPTNPVVDLKQVYATYGPGVYNYFYTVLSNDATCPDKSANIVITLEERLDFTGATLVIAEDICEDEIATAGYSGVITEGTTSIPNGQYRIIFNVSGPNGGTDSTTSSFVNGRLIFPINSQFFRQAGTFTVTITDIFSTDGKGACNNIINNLSDDLHIYKLPNLDNAILTPDPACQNKSSVVQLTNAASLDDGNYDIVYNLTGDNFALNQTANMTVTGGVGTFTIPGNLNANSGASVITITKITNTVTTCTNNANARGNMIINALPNASAGVIVNDVCLNDPVNVRVWGLGSLTDITLSYVLLGSNPAPEQTLTLTASGGNADFVIPSALLLNSGSTVVSLTNLKNNITGCDVNLTNVLDSFIINPIPAAPVVNPQTFCKVDGATIADLIPNGNQFKWYDSATSTTPLADTVILQSGNYYVKETSPADCTSDAATVLITINDTPAPVLNTDGQNFCGLNNPTIADLSNNTNVPSTVVWYDSPNNGNLLTASTPLTEQGKYYGFDLSNTTGCFSYDHIEVTVTLTDCDNVPNDFFIPDGFSPNGDGVNDSFVIKDIEFLYPDYTLEIFNRYGNGMYKGDKNKPAWDGINYEKSGIGSGVAPNGVYFYILYFNKDNKPPKQGRLYLNR